MHLFVSFSWLISFGVCIYTSDNQKGSKVQEKDISCEGALKAHSKVWDNFWQLKAFENDEKYFLFHLKSSFRSQDI